MEDLRDPSEVKEDFKEELPDTIKAKENVRHMKSMNTCLKIVHNQSVIYVIKSSM